MRPSRLFTASRRMLLRFLGVPTSVYDAADPLERERLGAVARSIMPLSRRVTGLRVDAGQTVRPWPLEQVKVPTLVLSAVRAGRWRPLRSRSGDRCGRARRAAWRG